MTTSPEENRPYSHLVRIGNTVPFDGVGRSTTCVSPSTDRQRGHGELETGLTRDRLYADAARHFDDSQQTQRGPASAAGRVLLELSSTDRLVLESGPAVPSVQCRDNVNRLSICWRSANPKRTFGFFSRGDFRGDDLWSKSRQRTGNGNISSRQSANLELTVLRANSCATLPIGGVIDESPRRRQTQPRRLRRD